MFGKIIGFFTKNSKYYIKVQLNDETVVFSSFAQLFSLLDGQPNEVAVCKLNGTVSVIIGEK